MEYHRQCISSTEKCLYFFVWILAVLYALYRFTNSSFSYFLFYEDKYSDFVSSSYYLPNKKDKADLEWEATHYLITEFLPWTLIYVGLSETIRQASFSLKVFQIWQISFTIVFSLLQVGYIAVLLILMQPMTFYILSKINKNSQTTWLCAGISLLSITYCKHLLSKEENLADLHLNHYQSYFVILSLFWMNLKCTSYFLENRGDGNILDLLSYGLYLPTVFTGPFLLYKSYVRIYKYNASKDHNLQNRIKKLVINFIRCFVWFLFADVSLHYVYVNATGFQPKFVETLDNWSLYGYGYAMGQFFHIKYVILYGLSTSFAAYENVSVPSLPRCIGRIHLYSDMWKYFDPGLYNFLLRNIYVPVLSVCRYKLIASFTCFLFVYVWHGVENYILVWTTLNYVGIVLEYMSRWMYERYLHVTKFEEVVDARWVRRLKCLMASPLLVLSAVSNFYFFAGTEIGNIFARRIYNDNAVSNMVLLIVLYCCCQVSTELRRVDAHTM